MSAPSVTVATSRILVVAADDDVLELLGRGHVGRGADDQVLVGAW